MATTTSFSGFTYNGELSRTWYAKWLLEPYTASRMLEFGSVMLNCKQPQNIPTITSGNVIGAAACNFTAGGSTTVVAKKLSTVELAAMEEYCRIDMEQTFLLAAMQSGTSVADWMPQDFADALMKVKGDKINQEVEWMIWRGDTGSTNVTYPFLDQMDGFLVKFAADSTVIDVTFAAAITSANVLTALGQIVDAFTDEIQQHSTMDDFFIGVPIHVARAYRRAITTGFTKPNDPTPLIFEGIKIEEIPGLPANNVVATGWRNLWLGTDIAGEERDIKLLWLGDTTGDEVTRLKANFRFGVEYAFGAHVVYGRL